MSHRPKIMKLAKINGGLPGVLPHHMRKCFPAAVYKTRFRDTKLELDLVVLENVGNLVCPAEFDTGAVKMPQPEIGWGIFEAYSAFFLRTCQ